MHKRVTYFLFGSNAANIILPKESIRLVTPHDIADGVSLYLKNHGVKTVIDATANVGGNTFSFAKYFDGVIAYEIDPITYEILVKNIDACGYKNISARCVDFNLLLDTSFKVDAVFIDPPWYIDGLFNENMQLTNDLNSDAPTMEEIVKKIRKKNPKIIIVIKVPKKHRLQTQEFEVLRYKKMDFLVFI